MQILIKKAGQSIDIDRSKFPAHVADHIFEYGIRQKLNDAISGLSKTGSDSTSAATESEMLDAVVGVLERLYAGDIRATRAAAPKTAEGLARQLAYKAVVNAWLTKNPKGKVAEFTNREELTSRHLDKNRDHFMALAQAQLDLAVDLDEV